MLDVLGVRVVLVNRIGKGGMCFGGEYWLYFLDDICFFWVGFYMLFIRVIGDFLENFRVWFDLD